MAEHRTPRVGLRYGDYLDPRPDQQIVYNWQLLDANAAIGSLAVVVAEYPSSTLRVVARGGLYADAAGTLHTLGDSAPIVLAAGATTCLWLSAAGAIVAGAAWPAAGAGRFAPLAVVVTGPTAVASIVDSRHPVMLIGS